MLLLLLLVLFVLFFLLLLSPHSFSHLFPPPFPPQYVLFILSSSASLFHLNLPPSTPFSSSFPNVFSVYILFFHTSFPFYHLFFIYITFIICLLTLFSHPFLPPSSSFFQFNSFLHLSFSHTSSPTHLSSFTPSSSHLLPPRPSSHLLYLLPLYTYLFFPIPSPHLFNLLFPSFLHPFLLPILSRHYLTFSFFV